VVFQALGQLAQRLIRALALLSQHHKEFEAMLLHDRLSRSARLAASVALLAATFATSAAFASPSAVAISSDPANGNILSDDRGMTLYRYTQDQPNTSTCYASCAGAWPPVVVDNIPTADPSLAAGLGIAARTDALASPAQHLGRDRRSRVVIEVIAAHGVHYNLISTWRTG